MKPPVPSLRQISTLTVELGPIREMGEGRSGTRRNIPVVGGSVTGGLSGKILDLGAEWQLIDKDGTALLDTRYAFETDDGALIEIVNLGFRHVPADVLARLAAGEDANPNLCTMRTSVRLETGDVRYAWVNRTVFVCSGSRSADGVEIDLYAVE